MTRVYLQDEETVPLVRDVVFDRLYWDRLDDGSITDEEIRQDICRRLPPSLHEISCRIYDHWMENMPPVDGMADLCATLKEKGCRLYLLSNISKEFARQYHRVPAIDRLLSRFDGLVFSGPLGIAKPQPAIYRYLLETYSLRPEECIFIDDRPENLDGARQVGIAGYWFDGDAGRLRQTLLTAED